MKSTEYQLDIFIQYIRTKQFFNQRKRDGNPNEPVIIRMSEIKRRFLVNPKVDLQILVDKKRLEIVEINTKNDRTINQYRVLEDGYYNLSLIQKKDIIQTPLTIFMKDCLMDVSLSENSGSTEYFDCFLLHKKKYLNLFFNIDSFSGRIHSPISNFHRIYRPNILLENQKTISFDVVTMQPLILGKILRKQIGENEFSQWIEEGQDIYKMIQDVTKCETRDEGKKRFFEILFSKPNKKLAELFGDANWILWINELKSKLIIENPHSIDKPHSNLAWLLQTTEVEIMSKIWELLYQSKIKFLSVHDEVIVQQKDKTIVELLIRQVLSKEFIYYKLNSKTE